jgi:integrase
MQWSDFSEASRKIYVVQEKTGTKLWVPAHKRLREYLDTLPRGEGTILVSPRGGPYAKKTISNLVCAICIELGFKGYSPHGLRHLAGASLAEAGCTTEQIKAVLGHLTDKQAAQYIKQANRVRMAEDAMDAWEAMDERDGNVTHIRRVRGNE